MSRISTVDLNDVDHTTAAVLKAVDFKLGMTPNIFTILAKASQIIMSNSEKHLMKKSILSSLFCHTILAAGILTSSLSVAETMSINGDTSSIGAATFNSNGELLLPEGYQKWVFIGAPLTPNGLNNGKAGFPEYHHVYVNPDAFAVFERTGKFPEGTVIAKELALVKKGKYKDGSMDAPSGRGYFAEKFNGMDVMVKDSKRFKKTNGWGFFNFGHNAPPYLKTAKVAPVENCASCHKANAKSDMVFSQFYPILN